MAMRTIRLVSAVSAVVAVLVMSAGCGRGGEVASGGDGGTGSQPMRNVDDHPVSGPAGDEQPAVGDAAAGTVAGAVHGVVRAPDGHPVPGVLVAATSIDVPSRAVPELAVVTDAAGAYEWPLQPGRYRLEATVAGVGSASAEVAVTDVLTEGRGPTVDLQLRA
jgi:hypothetical protein